MKVLSIALNTFLGADASPTDAFPGHAQRMRDEILQVVQTLTRNGIPVMGHVGLTPQAVNVLGGYGARGRTEAEAEKAGRQAHKVWNQHIHHLTHRAGRPPVHNTDADSPDSAWENATRRTPWKKCMASFQD